MSRLVLRIAASIVLLLFTTGTSTAQVFDAPPTTVPSPTVSPPSAISAIAGGPTSTEAGVVNEATAVLQELASGTATQIPEHLLASAEGVAIIPHYIRGAFVIGVAGGRGVLMVRDANHNWQAPEFMTIGGGSIGWQLGIQSTDLVLVFRTPKSLKNIHTGKVTLGANVSAAAGPIGRYASAATDARAEAEILTYSKTRGLFAGIALDGASLQIDVPATKVYYQTATGGPGVIPPSAITLVDQLNRLSATTVAAPDVTNPSQTAAPGMQPGEATIAITPGGLTPLETAVGSLLGSVDEQWKAYLALPANWQGATQLPAREVYETLSRYERVATNPGFATLKSMPTFDQALTLLRAVAGQSPQTHTLALPPPPDVSHERY